MILVLGCSGTGKSSLLKRLEDWEKTSSSIRVAQRSSRPINLNGSIEENPAASLNELEDDLPYTNPTIGANVRSTILMKHQEMVVKEIGGSMAPIWKSSYNDAEKVIYLIDISNPQQISASTCLVYEILTHDDLKNTPILIFLNKIDNFCTISHTEMKYLIGLDDILQLEKNITVIEGSVKYLTGIENLVKWITAK